MPISTARLAVGTGPDVTLSSTITEGAFSLTFDKPVLHRRTADGLHLVHTNGASVTAHAPATTTLDGASVNGFAPNVQASASGAAYQGVDGRFNGTVIPGSNSYSAALRPAMPWKPVVNHSVVLQNAAALKATVTPTRSGVSAGYHGFQFVNALPSTPATRLIAGTLAFFNGKVAASYDVDIDAKVAALPAYALTASTFPTAATVIARMDKFFGLACYTSVDTSSYGYESWTPQNTAETVAGGNTNDSNYGQYLARVIGAAALHLVGDAASAAQKKTILTRLIQIGCQVFEGSRLSGIYPAATAGLGGHNQWEFCPIVAYLWARNLNSDLDNLRNTYAGNVLNQCFRYTAGQIADLAPHDDPAKPNISRRRTISAVSGNNVTFNTYTGQDIPRCDWSLLRMVRNDGGVSAVINAMVSDTLTTPGNPPHTVTLASNPFIVSDVIYMQAQHTISVGDADWRVFGADTAIFPNATADYRVQNFFMEEVIFARALGVWRSDWDATLRYVERAQLANNPGSGTQDYLSHAENVMTFGMAQAFYSAHKTALGIA